MKTLNKSLILTSCAAVLLSAAPAMANPSVLCSVRANYQPGVDVKGNPVTPADVSDSAMVVPVAMTIPLTVDMAQRLNDVLPDGKKLEAQMGLVQVLADGRVFINGNDVSGPADAMCDTIAKQKESAMKTKDVVKKKKATSAPAKPSTPETAEPVVKAAPAPEVAQPEPVPAPEPAPILAPEPEPAPVVESAPVQPPQVLQAEPPAITAPEPVPTPDTAPVVDAVPPAIEPMPEPAPAPEVTPETTEQPAEESTVVPAPVPTLEPAPSSEIISPVQGGMIPRPPMDSLAPPSPPVPDGTLSGSAQ